MKIGIYSKDYRFVYRVALALTRRNIPWEIVDKEECPDGFDAVISDTGDGNFIHCKDPEECARKVQSYIYGKKKFERVIVGIDPGPKPGIAVVGDGNFVEEVQLSDVEEVRSYIDKVYEGYRADSFIVRIGDGDLVNRNRIINALVDDYKVELVDERNTSESINNKDIESAKVIAFTRGKRVRRKLNLIIREGYLRDIQRRSRIESHGEITISRSLAREVALGNLSLEEAIERMRRKNEEG